MVKFADPSDEFFGTDFELTCFKRKNDIFDFYMFIYSLFNDNLLGFSIIFMHFSDNYSLNSCNYFHCLYFFAFAGALFYKLQHPPKRFVPFFTFVMPPTPDSSSAAGWFPAKKKVADRKSVV